MKRFNIEIPNSNYIAEASDGEFIMSDDVDLLANKLRCLCEKFESECSGFWDEGETKTFEEIKSLFK